MPKKRNFNFNFKQLQGTSSSGKQASGSNGADKQTTSVNERLSELRRLEGKDAARKKQELAEAVSTNQRSVPPALRGVLGISESAPPKPKRGLRTRLPNRTPGPAPPQSWLKTSRLRLRERDLAAGGPADKNRNRPKQLLRFSRMTGLEGDDVDEKPSSLVDHALKTAAANWHLLDEDDLPAIAELPLRLRSRLLSYLAFYGPAIDIADLAALTEGSETLAVLDLGGITGIQSLPLSRVVKYAKSKRATIPAVSASPTLTSSVLESWDDVESFEAVLTSQPSTLQFTQLTHLSLSHPGPAATWRDLLALSKQTPSVTHLSLAYWPRPTLTPNLATATITSQHSPEVRAGGSHYYSALDEDLSEPASILRQLSGNLLRLQWLDLEGCNEWLPALSFLGAGNRMYDVQEQESDAWTRTPEVMSIFVNNWKNLQYLNFSQGWLPTANGLRALPRQTMGAQMARVLDLYVRTNYGSASEFWRVERTADEYDVEKRKAEMFLQAEERTYAARDRIAHTRSINGCKRIEFDHGWKAPAY